MAEKFKVALSRDFLTAEGEPLFPMFDRTPLDDDPDIEWRYLDNGEGPVDASELAGHDALILLAQRFDRSSVPSDGRLAMVARFGVGYDSVDVPACTDNDIALVITPNGVRRPVAVAIIALILAVTCKLLLKHQLTLEGPPGFARKGAHMGVGLVGKTLGSVGIGNIGAEMFRMAKPFDMNFMACDPYADPAVAEELGVKMVDLDTVCRESDILTVNCPLSDETHHIVDARLIGLMKPTAYFVNTSRGGTVDQKALTAALQEGRIAGAGLDVLDPEPPDPGDPILKLDNVVFAPHALAWTDQCFAGLGADDIVACKALMRGEAPAAVVNREIWTTRPGGPSSRATPRPSTADRARTRPDATCYRARDPVGASDPHHGAVHGARRPRHDRAMQCERERAAAVGGRMSRRTSAERSLPVVRSNVWPRAWAARPTESHLSHSIPLNPDESRIRIHCSIPPPTFPLPPKGGGGTWWRYLLPLSAPGGGEGRGEVGDSRAALHLRVGSGANQERSRARPGAVESHPITLIPPNPGVSCMNFKFARSHWDRRRAEAPPGAEGRRAP